MQIKIRSFSPSDIHDAIAIWNDVVEQGIAFPQTEPLTEETGLEFFQSQSFTGIAYDASSEKIVGLFILHPNNVGRCGHICNASYAVHPAFRGQGIGELLVKDSMECGKRLGFRILQFNAVVRSNAAALHLYEKLGFVKLGTIPGGFYNKSGDYEDIIPHYHVL